MLTNFIMANFRNQICAVLCLLSLQQLVYSKPFEQETPSPVDSGRHGKARKYIDLPLPIQGAESRNNPLFTEEGDEIYEGDMVLTTEQVEALYGDKDSRKAIGDLTYRWPNAYVPYEIDESSEPDREIIEKALHHWMDNTCLVFDEIKEGSGGPHLIFKKKKGCNSQVGMSWKHHPNGQDVSIGNGCTKMGTIAHEVGHAIGFHHEQTRPDRDGHVKIFLDNVKDGHTHNYDLHETINSYGVAYDLGSVMHYSLQEFTRNGKNTLVPLDPWKNFQVGQRAGLSFYDIKLADIMYNCSNKCSSKPSCENGGFVDHKCKCKCPPNTKGKHCETVLPEPEPECGGTITSEGTITSPNYPDKYPKGSKCVWWIKAPDGKKVKAHFKEFDLIQRSKDGISCHWDSVEVRTSSRIDGEIYCEDELQGEQLTSASDEMLILFKSEYDWNTGFLVDIKFK